MQKFRMSWLLINNNGLLNANNGWSLSYYLDKLNDKIKMYSRYTSNRMYSF